MLNRFERADEKPFEAVAAVSEFNQRAYELFAQPFVQAMSNEYTAKLARQFHPLRFQRWAFSRPESVARVARPGGRGGQGERAGRSTPTIRCAEVEKPAPRSSARRSTTTAALRDATSEASFFRSTATCSRSSGDRRSRRARASRGRASRATCRSSSEALASIDEGGYAEALARVGVPARRERGEPLPLSRLELQQELADEYAELLPQIAPDRVAPHPRRAGNHRPLRARAALATLPHAAARRRRPRALARRCSTGCWPTSACRRSQPTAEQTGDARAHPRAASRAPRRTAKAATAPRVARAHDAPPTAPDVSARNGRRCAMERQAREVPAADRLLQDAAADADGGRASLRRELAARARSRRRSSA